MKKHLQKLVLAGIALVMCTSVMAKLPALSDEAKAKAAEAAAKTAWSGKVDGYLLCKAQDKTVAHYKSAKTDAKETKAAKGAKVPAAASTCVDPGPFVYTPAAPVAAAAAAPPAAPAPAAAASAATATPVAATSAKKS
ncbi:hypothetical protein [Rhodoferax sp.]|uniref:hypothetical protein n=1 Tax=Rhodoferax sp. TaxID=50421 RepID=UPI001EC95ECF|nr:hypothetical protein [Rhodoferax sp.]MBT9506127.1 hypothetical protein [Rhodoferax sp.]